MTTWLPSIVAAGAIAATYFFCVRPHLRGRSCAMGGGQSADTAADPAAAELDRQLAELREELRVLRAQDALDTGRVPTNKPGPRADD